MSHLAALKQPAPPRNNDHANGVTHAVGRSEHAYLEVIDQICHFAWETIDRRDIIKIAKVYHYFSIQFRENLELSCRLYPKDVMLQRLYHGECNTDNLSPWPGVTCERERLNHDQFIGRLLRLQPLDDLRYLDEIGRRYLNEIRILCDTARAASIVTYEDGGLSRVFAAMLRAPQWQGIGQQAFKFFLEEHIRFDMDVDYGHGALARHLGADDEVLPLWLSFKEILLAAVPKLGFAGASLGVCAAGGKHRGVLSAQ